MLRTHSCGELRSSHINEVVTLSGWVQTIRDKGGLIWIDIRDRYGLTQLVVEDEGEKTAQIIETARKLGREFVIQAKGTVIARNAANPNIPTGEIEIRLEELSILNESLTPPFKIEDETDGGEDLRMRYRYLDIRRNDVREKLVLRHKVAQAVRSYLSEQEFIEVETPVLIKSTPEGARDFLVPSRMNEGQFYALPQSPQTFKQLLMVGGMDRYFQIVKCFRDEDLRADRQPEFTQIDCEMAFVERDDILNIFEEMMKYLFKNLRNYELPAFPHMEYADAMRFYGSDKPDTRFEMKFVELNEVAQNKGFKVFDDAEAVLGICAEGCASYTRKQLDELTNWVKRPQIGAKGLVYVKCNEDGTFKSSVDKFFDQEALAAWAEKAGAKAGDLLLVLSGELDTVRKQLGELRLEMGERLGLRDRNVFSPLWVVNFPLLEKDEETGHYHAMHHPFTSALKEDAELVKTEPWKARANAYDMVINGVEVGGGSIRIHDKGDQSQMFDALGFTKEEAQAQFGFLLDAFQYGAPPHGGIAFGFDRLCALFGGVDSIRDFIAFPKNTSGRDVMIDAPSPVNNDQLKDLGIKLK
ncbi:aspartate--tRNA ligase [Sediminitomix flava]|uniref:Aspartate--tRNA ligase n=1 Tax=Sediminitomix flava TaxID=379075 RepID=A0A315Z9V1_SEDFL|nr:aspartate--tRNA ligase [Sediminitomix flava]PWJ40984.1 aspartyl-tRNA synthetase [Sediminitomix flava]